MKVSNVTEPGANRVKHPLLTIGAFANVLWKPLGIKVKRSKPVTKSSLVKKYIIISVMSDQLRVSLHVTFEREGFHIV